MTNQRRPKPIYRTSTGARVTLTLEIEDVGSWGPDCTTEQVYRQAREAAIGRISKALAEYRDSVRIVGTIRVEAITTGLERRGEK